MYPGLAIDERQDLPRPGAAQIIHPQKRYEDMNVNGARLGGRRGSGALWGGVTGEGGGGRSGGEGQPPQSSPPSPTSHFPTYLDLNLNLTTSRFTPRSSCCFFSHPLFLFFKHATRFAGPSLVLWGGSLGGGKPFFLYIPLIPSSFLSSSPPPPGPAYLHRLSPFCFFIKHLYNY